MTTYNSRVYIHYAGVGEAYKRAALSVKSDVGFIRLLPHERLPEVMAAITTMDAEVAFRFMSIDLNYNKVIGVLVSVVVGVLFVVGPRLID